MESRNGEDVYNTITLQPCRAHTLHTVMTVRESNPHMCPLNTQKHTVLFHFLPRDVQFTRSKMFPVCVCAACMHVLRAVVMTASTKRFTGDEMEGGAGRDL